MLVPVPRLAALVKDTMQQFYTTEDYIPKGPCVTNEFRLLVHCPSLCFIHFFLGSGLVVSVIGMVVPAG